MSGGERLLHIRAERLGEELQCVAQQLARDTRLVQRFTRRVWQGDLVRPPLLLVTGEQMPL